MFITSSFVPGSVGHWEPSQIKNKLGSGSQGQVAELLLSHKCDWQRLKAREAQALGLSRVPRPWVTLALVLSYGVVLTEDCWPSSPTRKQRPEQHK